MMKFVVFTILVMLSLGCARHYTTGLEIGLKEGTSQAVVRMDDNSIGRFILVEKAVLRRAETGFPEANVSFRNESSVDYTIQYKFEWFDADGITLQTGGHSWEPKTLKRGELVSISAAAPGKNAVEFLVHIRPY